MEIVYFIFYFLLAVGCLIVLGLAVIDFFFEDKDE
jgi:hypothetical protein